MSPDPVRFYTFTDFGASSIYVGQMAAVIHSIQPRARISSLSDTVPRQNPEAGAFLLQNSLPYLPDHIYLLCVVDPGVGTNRPIVAVHLETPTCWLVGPDNGLFSVLNDHNPVVHRVENKQFWREDVTNTFHGRDIMAPVLAHLSDSADLREVGPEQDSLAPLDPPDLLEPVVEEDRLQGRVIYTDPFGNSITNIHISDLRKNFGEDVREAVQIHTGRARLDRIYRSYSDVGAGTPLALIGSSGHLELAVNQGHAGNVLNLQQGSEIHIQDS